MSDAENTTREKIAAIIMEYFHPSELGGSWRLNPNAAADALIAAFPTLTTTAGTDEGYRRDVKYAIASELEDELTEHGRFDLNDLDDNEAYWALMERVTSAVVSVGTETHEATEPSDEYVRDFYAKFQANLGMHSDYSDEAYELAEREFDAWMSAHDKRVVLAHLAAKTGNEAATSGASSDFTAMLQSVRASQNHLIGTVSVEAAEMLNPVADYIIAQRAVVPGGTS